jgi:pectinesterase
MNNHFKIKHRVEFRGMLVQLALKQALIMQKEAQENSHQNSSVHKMVHGDCLKLFENTIFHLNRTLEGLNNSNKTCSPHDAQTWLTTSLTNIETCKSGALELNAQDFNFIVQTNVIEMIRNILAINMYFMKHNKGNNNNFILFYFYQKLSISHLKIIELILFVKI